MGKGKKLKFMALVPYSGWWVIGEIMRKALAHEGFEVEVMCLPFTNAGYEQRRASVASGNADFGINPGDEMRWAFHGIGPYEGRAIPDLRIIASVAQPFWFVFAVTYETRLTAIEQIKEQKFPLRIYTFPAFSGISCQAFITGEIFKAYGFTPQDIESWGGKHWTIENGGDQAISEHNFDAILSRVYQGCGGPMGKFWHDAAVLNNLRFLPMSSKALDELSKKYRLHQGFIPRFLRGVEENVPTIYYPYSVIYTSRHLDEEVAFIAAKSLDEHPDCFLDAIMPTSYHPLIACRDTGVPFHPGAERYYRSRGYIK